MPTHLRRFLKYANAPPPKAAIVAIVIMTFFIHKTSFLLTAFRVRFCWDAAELKRHDASLRFVCHSFHQFVAKFYYLRSQLFASFLRNGGVDRIGKYHSYHACNS